MIFLKRRAFMTFKFNYETSKGIKQVILTNCGQAPFKRFSILGNSHQDSTTGKQLFDVKTIVRDMVIELDGNLVNGKGYFTSDFIKVEPSTTYYINATGNKRGKYFDENKKVIFTNSFSDFNPERGTVITTHEKASYIRFSGYLENVETIMLNKGSSATPYEPYTGGKPSPSPDYPQEIKNVGKWNEETQKYEVDVKVTGKNIVNIKDIDITVQSKETWYEVHLDKNVVISAQEYADYSSNVWIFALVFMDGKKEYLTHSEIRKTKRFVIKSDNPVVKIVTRGTYITNGKYAGIMVEYGDIASPYEPYFPEQTAIITSDRPITKWDKLEKRDGQIGWLYKTGLEYKDITESKVDANNIDAKRGRYYVRDIVAYKGADSVCSIKDIGTGEVGFIYNNTFCVYLDSEYTGNDGTETLDIAIQNFKNRVLSKGITVQYEKKEAEFVPLPQSEQDAIRALTTYHPTTVITVDGGEVDAGIEVEYAVKNKE